MSSSRSFAGVALAFVLSFSWGACGGGGGGGSSDLVVSGSVLTPAGQGLPAPMSGLAPVPDGTPVALVRLDPAGHALATLDTTHTSGGRYSFDLSARDVDFASDLAVVAGNAPGLRALVVAKSIDVDPISDAVLRLLLEPGTGLPAFTVGEVRDLLDSVRLLVAAQELGVAADLEATIELVVQAVHAEPGLSAFVAAASAQGETSEGPGDVGDYFPAAVGNVWRLDGVLQGSGQASQIYTHVRRVAKQTLGSIFVDESDALAESGTIQHVFTETGRALVYEGNDDPADPLTPLVAPYDQLRFPLRAGEKFQQFARNGVPLGEDLDLDGKLDKADVRSTVRTVAFEDVVVAAGSFSHCARIETKLELALLLTTGIPATSTVTSTDWLAPHRGPVRSEAVLKVVVAGQKSSQLYTETLGAFQVDDEGFGVLPAVAVVSDVSPANSNTEEPGRPGVAFDGSRYLVVTVRDGTPFDRLVGAFVGANGVAGNEFTIVSATSHMFGEPAVAFDGTDYLVVYGENAQIRGVRVGGAGNVLDPSGFAISSSGSSNFSPALAFDGVNYLVVWSHWDPVAQGDVYGALVRPNGVAQGEFVVNAAPGSQLAPAIDFDATQYVVVWQASEFPLSKIRGARVDITGVVQDPLGFDVAASAVDLSSPELAYDGTRHLVVWNETGPAGALHVRGLRIASDGTPADPTSFAIAATPTVNLDVAVAHDGTNWLVAWSVRGYSAPAGVYARRVASSGALLDGSASSLGLLLGGPSTIAQPVHPLVVAGASSWFVAWVRNVELLGEEKDVVAALVYPF